MSWLYSDIAVEKAKMPANGRRYVRIDIGHVFSKLQLDWTSGSSFADQYDPENARREI